MKIIKTGKEARKLLKQGVDKTVDAVKTTLGPSGQNAILDRLYNKPVVTNDGVSIADKIELEDEIENIGAEMIKSISKNTDDDAGDGTTTSMVLAQAIIETGFKELEGGLINKSVMDIKREIDRDCKIVVEEIKKLSRPIVKDGKIDLEMLEYVAYTSVEDKRIAKLLVEVFSKVGKNGLITVEESDSFDFDHEIQNGLEIKYGYVSPYMADKEDKAEIKDVKVLVTNHQINGIEQIGPLATALAETGISKLVIFAEGFSEEDVKELVLNKLEKKFNILAIEGKEFKEVAAITGAKLINADSKLKLESTKVEDLGHADKVISVPGKTTIVGGKGDASDIIKELEESLDGLSKLEKEKTERKISQLSSGVGVIKVGARSEEERDYYKLKLEDAINALKAAVDEGIVPGGGQTLNNLADKTVILSEALRAPYNQIQENAGGKLEIPETVFDPTKVVIKGLENACSVASVLLTTGTVVANKKEENGTS